MRKVLPYLLLILIERAATMEWELTNVDGWLLEKRERKISIMKRELT
jgi:hypothetical protein